MSLTDIRRLQGYLILYTLAAGLLGFVVLPALVSLMTPFRFKEVSRVGRSAFLLAFATGRVLVVIPLIIEGAKSLFAREKVASQDTDAAIDLLVPLGFPFPHLGRLLITLFIPFSAWYLGEPLAAGRYPELMGAAFFTHFASSSISIPFLLDLMELPNDMFQLFVVTGMYVDRLSNGLAAIYFLVFTVITTSLVHLGSRPRWRALGALAAGTALGLFVLVAATRSYLVYASRGAYDKTAVLGSMYLLENPTRYEVVPKEPNPVPLRKGQSHLERILARRTLRVGYQEDALPFSYTNVHGDLVGFDIDMMHRFARELDVGLEFVPASRRPVEEGLHNDHFDVAVGGLAGTVERSRDTPLSDPYLFVTMAFVVPDYRDEDFASLAGMNALGPLRIGVTSRGWFLDKLHDYLPEAEVVLLDAERDFFERRGAGADVDALLYSAEAGAAWTLVYPDFQVATPLPGTLSIPLVYPFAGRGDSAMDELMDHWVMLKTRDGTVQSVYDHWILGQGSRLTEPRWSILRDVLHWVD